MPFVQFLVLLSCRLAELPYQNARSEKVRTFLAEHTQIRRSCHNSTEISHHDRPKMSLLSEMDRADRTPENTFQSALLYESGYREVAKYASALASFSSYIA